MFECVLFLGEETQKKKDVLIRFCFMKCCAESKCTEINGGTYLETTSRKQRAGVLWRTETRVRIGVLNYIFSFIISEIIFLGLF